MGIANALQNSALGLAWHALRGHRHWRPFWRTPEPRASYDVVIVGGGGHGLATAHALATKHGVRSVAVLEKGWLGGGNTGRNTTIVRSNYLATPSARFYDHSLKVYEGLSRALDYNVMFIPRGVVNLATSRFQLRTMRRRVEALRLAGVDSEMLDVEAIRALMPRLQIRSTAGCEVFGGFIQRRAGIARHDAVAWGYARAADRAGVDIIQNCEVTGFERNGDEIRSVQTSCGRIGVDKVAICVAGHSSVLAEKLGLRLPITSMALQAMVSEPVKPVLDVVLDGGFYVSQSDRGELVMGGGTDVYTSYAQRSGLQRVEDNMAALVDLFPSFARLRFMRQWAGIIDLTPDSSPIIDAIGNVALSCGWGSWGFKAIPAGGECLAHLIATGKPHPLAEAFSLERFTTGALIDEAGSSGGMDDREPLL